MPQDLIMILVSNHPMAEIHGWIWVIVGTFVIGVSLYIGNLRFFIIIGSIFIAWGSFKLCKDYMLPKEQRKPKPWETAPHLPNPTLHKQIHQQRGSNNLTHRVRAVLCPMCKTQVWNNAHFCHFCGIRLKNN